MTIFLPRVPNTQAQEGGKNTHIREQETFSATFHNSTRKNSAHLTSLHHLMTQVFISDTTAVSCDSAAFFTPEDAKHGRSGAG